MDDLQYLQELALMGYQVVEVLNLVIYGWPSIPQHKLSKMFYTHIVLNLVIYGWPSIRRSFKKFSWCT